MWIINRFIGDLTNKLADELHHRVIKSAHKNEFMLIQQIKHGRLIWQICKNIQNKISTINSSHRRLSQYGWLIPFKNKTGVTVSEAFKNYLEKENQCIFGQIKVLNFIIDK